MEETEVNIFQLVSTRKCVFFPYFSFKNYFFPSNIDVFLDNLPHSTKLYEGRCNISWC